MANEKRLIDANKISYHKSGFPKGDGFDSGLDWAFREDIDKLPTVDAVEVVHGEWIGTQYDGYADGAPVYDLWECSNCRDEYESEGDPPSYNYCPNCGAKMDLEVQ